MKKIINKIGLLTTFSTVSLAAIFISVSCSSSNNIYREEQISEFYNKFKNAKTLDLEINPTTINAKNLNKVYSIPDGIPKDIQIIFKNFKSFNQETKLSFYVQLRYENQDLGTAKQIIISGFSPKYSEDQIFGFYDLFKDSLTINSNIDPNTISAQNVNQVFNEPPLPSDITADYSDFNVYANNTLLKFNVQLKYKNENLGSSKQVIISGFLASQPQPDYLTVFVEQINNLFTQKSIFIENVSDQEVPQEMNLAQLINLLNANGDSLGKQLAKVLSDNQSKLNIRVSKTVINYRKGTFDFKLEVSKNGIIKYTNQIKLSGYKAPESPNLAIDQIIKKINDINTTISMQKTGASASIDLPSKSIFNEEIARFFKNSTDANAQKIYSIFNDKINQAFYNFELIFSEKSFDLGEASVIFKIIDNNRHVTKYSNAKKLNNFNKITTQKTTPLKSSDIKKWIDDLNVNANKKKYFELVNGAAWILPEKIQTFQHLSIYLQKEFIFILNNYFNISFTSKPVLNVLNTNEGSFEVSLKIINQYDSSDIATTNTIKFFGMKKQLSQSLNSATSIAQEINKIQKLTFSVNANGSQRPNDIFWDFDKLKEYLRNDFSSLIPDNYQVEFDTNKGGILTSVDGEIKAYLKITSITNFSDFATTEQITINGFEKYRINRVSRLSAGMKEMRKIIGNAGSRYQLINTANSVFNTKILEYSDLEIYLSADFKKILTTNYDEYGDPSIEPIKAVATIIGGIDYSDDDAISLYLRVTNINNYRDSFVTNKLTFTGFKHYKQRITISPEQANILKIDASNFTNPAIANLSSLNAYGLKNLLLQDESTLIDKLWPFIKTINNKIGATNNLKLTKNDVMLNFNTISTPASPNQSILAFSFSLSISGQQRFFINKDNMISMFITNLNQNVFQNYDLNQMAQLIKDRTNSSEILVLSTNDPFAYLPSIKFNQLVNRFQNIEKYLFHLVLNSGFKIELTNTIFDDNLGILKADLVLSKNSQSIILKDFNFRGFVGKKATIVFKNKHDDTNNQDIIVNLQTIDKEKNLSAKEFYNIFHMPFEPNPDDNPYDIEYLNKFIARELLIKYIRQTIKSNTNTKVQLEAEDIKITKYQLKENTNALGFWFKLSAKGQEKFECSTIDGERPGEKFDYINKRPPFGNYIEIQGFNSYSQVETLSKTEAAALVTQYSGRVPASALSNYKYIESQAFAGNNQLISINIPDNVLNIGSAAFLGCDNLIDAHLSDSLFMIPDNLFWKADSLKTVNIPKDITIIGERSFGGEYDEISNRVIGPDLNMNLVLPNSVKFIKAWAFSFSTIKSFVGGSELLYIGWGSFVGSPDNRNKQIDFSKSNKLVKIDNNAFQDNFLVTSLVLPDTVEFIGAYAFQRAQIREIIIPEKVSKIRAGAFYLCQNLASVEMGNSVIEIGGSAFEECRSLKSIIIPHSVEFISSFAFKNSGLTRVDLGKVALIGPSAFEGVKLEELVIPSSVKLIDRRAFANNGGSIKQLIFESVISPNFNNGDKYFPNQIDNIAEQAFANSLGIKELYIPANVKKIGTTAFANNLSITKIHFVESIGIAFQGFSIIKQNAFSGLENLVSIEIPNIYRNRNIDIGLTNEQRKMIRWY